MVSSQKCFVEVYEQKPEDFFLQVETVACYVEVDGLLLLLENSLEKSEPGTFGVPAGKLEVGETLEEGAKRELWEETGIIAPLVFLGTLYIRKPGFSYSYHLFKALLDETPEVKLSSEHISYKWASKEEIKKMPLMLGAQQALHKYYASEQKEFYYVRHGQTDHNLLEGKDKGDHQGMIPLNERGRLQARHIEPLIASLQVRTVVASPMKRAQETKAIITERVQASHYEVENLGECTDKLWKGLRDLHMDSPIPEGGELFLFLERVRKGLNEALSFPGPILIVAHGGVHRAICFLMKVEEHDWHLDNCEVVHFLLKEDQKWVAKKL